METANNFARALGGEWQETRMDPGDVDGVDWLKALLYDYTVGFVGSFYLSIWYNHQPVPRRPSTLARSLSRFFPRLRATSTSFLCPLLFLVFH